MPVLETRDLARTYRMGETLVQALRGVSLSVERGEFVAIMGPSGSGKSTLMNILGCLDRPTEGRYVLDGVDVTDLGRDARAAIRNEKIGFVFQSFNLLARTSAEENVELPLLYSPRFAHLPEAARRDQVFAALDRVGLRERADHTPAQLSGGQQQRVAIARALVTDPAILLADEPTGNLDSTTSEEVLALFQRLNGDGRTILLITHEHDVAEHASRVVTVRDGKIQSDVAVARPRIARPSGGAA